MMKTKKYNDEACASVKCSCAEKEPANAKETLDYGFYSNVLKKPFERLDDLKKAEYVYYEEQKAKENKVAAKKADAALVEEAFKALNQTRKAYKEGLVKLTEIYGEDLKKLKETFESDKKELHDILAEAEKVYSDALKAFTNKYPEGYHLTLKDGDFETTISSKSSNKELVKPLDLFDLFFGF